MDTLLKDLRFALRSLRRHRGFSERRGWLRSEWGRSENNRRAKYYDLTAKGRRELKTQTVSIRRYANALLGLLAAKRA